METQLTLGPPRVTAVDRILGSRRALWLANEAAETGLPAELDSLTL